MNTISTLRPTALATSLLAALLTACGGGGGDTTTTTDNVSQTTAQAMSANTAATSEDGSESADTLLVTTEAIVANANANATYNCAGGGTATFTASGGTLASLANHALDAGEVYTVTYTDCVGAAGLASLNGSAQLTVVAAGGGTTQVQTSTTNLKATLPLRTLTWNGSSEITRTVATVGTTTTTTTHWTSPSIALTSQRNARTSTFTLSNVDLTRTIVATNGVVTSRTESGTHTMTADLPNGSWTVTTASQGGITFDANGVPIAGAWTITLPNNTIAISVVPGTLTVTVDYGSNGSIDRTWTFSTSVVTTDAG